MAKRKASVRSARSAPSPTRSGVRTVICLNTKKLRDQALAALRRAEKAFEEADRVLKEFEQIELPSFARIQHLRLGPLFSELNQRQAEYSELHYHYCLAEEEHWRTGQPIWRCHERLLQEEADYKNRPAGPSGEATSHADEPEDGDEGDDFDEDLKQFLNDLGLDDEDVDDFFGEDRVRPPTAKGKDGEPKGSLRQNYRQLCRLLHPDAAGALSPEQQQVWHQVQEAYRDRDEVRLETLLARVQQAVGIETVPRTLAELRAAANYFRRAREKLRRTLQEAKRHPAWSFSRQTEAQKERSLARMADSLNAQLKSWNYRVEQLKRALARPPERMPRKKRRPVDDRNLEFNF